MKLNSSNKKWLLPLIAACILTGCKKNVQEISNPATQTETDSKKGGHNFDRWIINTAAGSDDRGYSGDGGPVKNAILNDPENVYVDSRGNIFISDLGN